MKNNLKIKSIDFERIYRIINSILISRGHDQKTVCTIFSMYGAEILKKHYGTDARLVSGSCYYRNENENGKSMYFGKIDGDEIESNINFFHCLVEAEGWYFDFMSPNLEEIGSIMIQKKINTTNKKNKDFSMYFTENSNLTNYLTKEFQHPEHRKLIGIANKWFKKAPEKINPLVKYIDEIGIKLEIILR